MVWYSDPFQNFPQLLVIHTVKGFVIVNKAEMALLFTWGQTMVKIMKIMMTSFKRSYACTASFSAPSPAAGHCRPMPLQETAGHSWACLGQSLVRSVLFSPGSWCTQSTICALQEPVSSVQCKFCKWLSGPVHGYLLQED